MSAGSDCRSESSVTMMRPREARSPAAKAEESPEFFVSRMRRTRGSLTCRRRTKSTLPSLDPSSTTITSAAAPNVLRTAWSSSQRIGRVWGADDAGGDRLGRATPRDEGGGAAPGGGEGPPADDRRPAGGEAGGGRGGGGRRHGQGELAGGVGDPGSAPPADSPRGRRQ